MNKLLLLLFCSFFLNEINAQTILNITNSPLDTIDCNQNCHWVHANFIKPKLTTSYTVSTIPFNPVNITGTTIALADDKFSAAVPIGFDFCFYGNVYSQVYISTNGHLSFNSNYASASCTFDTKTPMPFYNSTYPDNSIFCPFTDGYTLAGGTIKYATIGTQPFRKFIVSYSSIPYFGVCSGSPSTFQCILNETSNIIECHITNKSTCNADTTNYLNYATLGIQSIGANNFLTAPGKNATIWNATNQAWQFLPNGAIGYTLKWYENNFLLSTNTDSISVCGLFPKKIVAKLTLSCPNKIYEDSIQLVKLTPKWDSLKVIKTSCKNTWDGKITVFASSFFPPITYSLNSGPFVSNNIFNNAHYGINNLSIKDANGCIKDTVIMMSTLSTLTAHIDSFKHPKCPYNNGKITGSASGGVPPYTYQWTGGASGTTINNLGPGIYYFTVTDANGCKDSTGITLVWDSLPNVTAILSKPVCGNASGSIDISPSSGTPPYTYSWSNGAITQDINNLSAGTYTVTISDVNGCSKLKSYTIYDTLNMQIGFSNIVHTTCGLNNGKANIVATSGMPPIQYLWSNGNTTFNATNLSAGAQYVTVIDGNGCTRIDTTTINNSLALAIQFLPANSFCDSANGLINTIITNGTGSLQYTWNTGQITNSIHQLEPNDYWLKVTDSLGCEAIDTVTIKDDGVPHLKVVQYIPPVCKGDKTGQLTLYGISGVAPYKYSFDGITFSATAQLSNFSAGTYTIFIRDANSCISDTIITFPEGEDIVIINTLPDSVICYHDTTAKFSVSTSSGTPPYLWSINNSPFSNNTQFTNLAQGIYTIQVVDSKNCKSSKSVTVYGPYLPLNATLKTTDIACYEELTGKLEAEISGGWQPLTFKWSHLNSLFLFLDNQKEGIYSITVTDKKGCVFVVTDTIQQTYCCNSYLPNSFTPNGDGLNDVFKAITPNTDISEYALKIYNRWGQEVFSTKEITAGWDGRIKGVDADMDSYYFIMIYKCTHSKEKLMRKGDVLLLR